MTNTQQAQLARRRLNEMALPDDLRTKLNTLLVDYIAAQPFMRDSSHELFQFLPPTAVYKPKIIT